MFSQLSKWPEVISGRVVPLGICHLELKHLDGSAFYEHIFYELMDFVCLFNYIIIRMLCFLIYINYLPTYIHMIDIRILITYYVVLFNIISYLYLIKILIR